MSETIRTEEDQINNENPVFRKLVEKLPSNYSVESHATTTDDGYLLKIFRIMPEFRDTQDQRPAVLLQHGMLACSETFVNDGEYSWAAVLADAGYDVWIGNTRGNIYSRGHTSLTQSDDAYYNFSFYEMGQYDIPAMVDYIITQTGEEKISYIGHSQGTTQMFSALAENQGDIKNKINLFIALSPVVYLQNTRNGFLQELANDINSLQYWLDYFGIHLLFGPEWSIISQGLCMIKVEWCEKANEFLEFNRQPHWGDIGVDEMHEKDLNIATTKQLAHFGQMVKSGKFQQYDDLSGNPIAQIPLSNIDDEVPIYLYAGLDDSFAAAEDVQKLRQDLFEVKRYNEYPGFDHGTFTHFHDFPWFKDEILSAFEAEDIIPYPPVI